MAESRDMRKARELLELGGHTCVLVRDGLVRTSDRRGVAPLLGWLDEGVDCAGASAADKVVGNGAAYLYVLLDVAAVHAGVMSGSAQAILAHHGIAATCDNLVKAIENRTHDGFCPIEMAVADIDPDRPQDAPTAIRACLAQLAG